MGYLKNTWHCTVMKYILNGFTLQAPGHGNHGGKIEAATTCLIFTKWPLVNGPPPHASKLVWMHVVVTYCTLMHIDRIRVQPGKIILQHRESIPPGLLGGDLPSSEQHSTSRISPRDWARSDRAIFKFFVVEKVDIAKVKKCSWRASIVWKELD